MARQFFQKKIEVTISPRSSLFFVNIGFTPLLRQFGLSASWKLAILHPISIWTVNSDYVLNLFGYCCLFLRNKKRGQHILLMVQLFFQLRVLPPTPRLSSLCKGLHIQWAQYSLRCVVCGGKDEYNCPDSWQGQDQGPWQMPPLL